MSKVAKIFSFIAGLVLISIFYVVAFVSSKWADIPSHWKNYLPNLSVKHQWVHFFADYYFLFSVSLLLVTIILIIVAILYPRQYTEILLKNSNGKLILKKSALESYIRTLVKKLRLMRDPHVKITIYRRKFKILITGELFTTADVTNKTKLIEQKINQDINDFFALDGYKVNFEVKVKNINHHTNKTRVR